MDTMTERMYWRRQATLTTTLLTLCLVLTGCSSRPLPGTFNAPPLDAYALSGGKIKHFQGTPNLPADPAAKGMLLACQQLPIHTDTARSAFLVITAGQFGKSPLHALVIGNRVLMLLGDLATMGITSGNSGPNFTLYPGSPESITFITGSKTAFVGSKKIPLQDPVIATESHDLVMTFADIKTIFHERDVQRKQPPFIRDAKIIYDIEDYQR